jgi:hypothetical protein
MAISIKVLLDVHHYLPKAAVAKRRFVAFHRLDALHGERDEAELFRLEWLRLADSLGTKQPFQLVWTAHHEFCVRNVLAEADWSAREIDLYVKACRALAIKTGGEISKIDYRKESKTNAQLEYELSKMGGTFGTPCNEDAAILKMALDLRCDILVTNDGGLLKVKNNVKAKTKTHVWTIEDYMDTVKKALSFGHRAAA